MSTDGAAQGSRAGVGPRLEGFALREHQGEIDLHAGRDRRLRRDPADLDDARPARTNAASRFCDSTGTAKPSLRSKCRLGDFFACGWNQYCQINSLPVCVNPGSAFNCQWNMPFRKHCKITLENLDEKNFRLYYQVNYTLTDVPADAAYFHAQFRRVPKLPLQGRLHHSRRREGPRAIRGHVHGLRIENDRLVGRRRDQVLPGRRRKISDHRRHRHRRLLLRLLRFRRLARRDCTSPSARLTPDCRK